MTSELEQLDREHELCKLSHALSDEAMTLAKTPSQFEVRRGWVARALWTHQEMVNFIAFRPANPTDEAMMGATNQFKKLINMLRVKWNI